MLRSDVATSRSSPPAPTHATGAAAAAPRAPRMRHPSSPRRSGSLTMRRHPGSLGRWPRPTSGPETPSTSRVSGAPTRVPRRSASGSDMTIAPTGGGGRNLTTVPVSATAGGSPACRRAGHRQAVAEHGGRAGETVEVTRIGRDRRHDQRTRGIRRDRVDVHSRDTSTAPRLRAAGASRRHPPRWQSSRAAPSEAARSHRTARPRPAASCVPLTATEMSSPHPAAPHWTPERSRSRGRSGRRLRCPTARARLSARDATPTTAARSPPMRRLSMRTGAT